MATKKAAAKAAPAKKTAAKKAPAKATKGSKGIGKPEVIDQSSSSRGGHDIVMSRTAPGARNKD
jgi:hypothetical protein